MKPKKVRYNEEGLLEIKCCNCGRWKLSIDFSKKGQEKRTGKSAWCLKCKREYNRQYWRDHYIKKERRARPILGRAQLAFRTNKH